MGDIRSCLLEICTNEDNSGPSKNYLLYSSLLDKNNIQEYIYNIAQYSRDEDGFIDFDKFKDTLDEEENFTIYEVSNYTSYIYLFHNDNMHGHKVKSYEVDFNKFFYVDLEKSEEDGDIINLVITDNKEYFKYTLKNFQYCFDSRYEKFNGILSDIEVLALIVIDFCKFMKCDITIIPISYFLGFFKTYITPYCDEIDIELDL